MEILVILLLILLNGLFAMSEIALISAAARIWRCRPGKAAQAPARP